MVRERCVVGQVYRELRVDSMPQTVYLSLGSNLGDRERNLRVAVEALSRELHEVTVSSLYETEPVGVLDQPAFLNLAMQAQTDLDPESLLALVKRIEQQVGRTPTFRWGPRIVDIDILMYDDQTLEVPNLHIPHREMLNRAFVLVPLAEIAPDLIHPTSRRRIRELRDEVPGLEGVRLVGPYSTAQTGTDLTL
jgi:2-amino-4-hydroxy-6-hydroxymethyldihydropteridine diphosphokinase